MHHWHSSWSDLPPFPLPWYVPSPLYPSHIDEEPLDPRTAGQSGRLATQSPITVYGWVYMCVIVGSRFFLMAFEKGR